MQTAHTIADVERLLTDEFMPATAQRERFSLDRMYTLMELLGNPQNKLQVIHVAGTSGKTSTCYYISALLQAAGQKVGLTVSPHVDVVNERVQIDTQPLPERQFCQYFNQFVTLPGLIELRASYFEIMIAFAFWVFVQEEVDYAVVEVGIGGLGDSTNVIDRSDKVCVITDIGLDHTTILGETITKITRQKAGIIQEGNQVFIGEQNFTILDIVESVAAMHHANVTVVPDDAPGFLRLLPPFMRRNWQLAHAVTEYLSERDGLPTLHLAELTQTTRLTVPARMEVVAYKDKTIVLDGSHNQQKLTALVEALQERFSDRPKVFLLGFIQDKQALLTEALASVAPAAHAIMLTSFTTKQDAKHNSLPADVVAQATKAAGIEDVQIIEDPRAAFADVLNRPEPIIVVTGSFYLLNHIRPIIKNEEQV